MIYDANQEQIELDAMKQAVYKANEKARNEAEYLIKRHKLDQVSDMVLEALIDDLMMERDARTYAFEAETNFYKGLGI
jgi:Asp-tRNA(Asn)/Glu-tRNA(Gln) amidotransferase B subunit